MCYLYFGTVANGNRVNSEPVVLCSDLTFSGYQIDHRVVQTPMPVVHLESGDPFGKRQ